MTSTGLKLLRCLETFENCIQYLSWNNVQKRSSNASFYTLPCYFSLAFRGLHSIVCVGFFQCLAQGWPKYGLQFGSSLPKDSVQLVVGPLALPSPAMEGSLVHGVCVASPTNPWHAAEKGQCTGQTLLPGSSHTDISFCLLLLVSLSGPALLPGHPGPSATYPPLGTSILELY